MRLLAAQAQQQWEGSGQKPLFLYDNNKIQNFARYQQMGIRGWQRVRIPPRSPDLNKPVEHMFHRIKAGIRERLYTNNELLTPQMVQQWVVDIFFEKQAGPDGTMVYKQQEMIKKDVLTLPLTWLAVSTDKGQAAQHTNGTTVQGSGGDYPAPHLC